MQFQEKLDKIEERIIKLDDRDSRKRQFRLHTYSMVMGAMIAFSIPLILDIIKSHLSNDRYSVFITAIFYLIVIVFFIVWAKSKQLLDIGDFVFTGNMDVPSNDRKKFVQQIFAAVKDNNPTLTISIVPLFTGLNKFNYHWNTFKENFDQKLVYCIKNIDKLKTLEIDFSTPDKKSSYISDIVFNFERKRLTIELYDKHFSTKMSKKVLDDLGKLKTKYSFFKKEDCNIRGF